MNWLTFIPFLVGATIFFLIIGLAISYVNGYLQALRDPPSEPREVRAIIKLFGWRWPTPFEYMPPSDGATGKLPAAVEVLTKRRGGRPIGSLSAGNLPPGTTLEQMLPFIRQAKAAREAKDGSFADLIRNSGYSESTVRRWIDLYGKF